MLGLLAARALGEVPRRLAPAIAALAEDDVLVLFQLTGLESDLILSEGPGRSL